MVASKNDLTISTTLNTKVKKVSFGLKKKKKLQPTEELLLRQKLRDYTLLGVEGVDTISLHFLLPSRRDKWSKIVPGFQIIYYIL